jgi:hypothetical protein
VKTKNQKFEGGGASEALPAQTASSWQVRAASLEQDHSLPRTWAGTFARLLCGAPPSGFGPSRWGSVTLGASTFAEQWAAQAFRLGWSAEEVFGLDEIAPAARYDCMGVAWLLSERHVVALDGKGADIETARGVRQRCYLPIFAAITTAT